MFGTRTRKIVREIWSRKTRTILVALNIFIGVLGVVTLTSVSDLMTSTTRRDLHQDELAMVYMDVDLEDYSNIDNARTLATLREHPGVTVVEGWLGDPLFWKSPGDQNFVDGIILASSEPFGQIRIAPPRLIEGRYPVSGQHQLAVERRMADRYGAACRRSGRDPHRQRPGRAARSQRRDPGRNLDDQRAGLQPLPGRWRQHDVRHLRGQGGHHRAARLHHDQRALQQLRDGVPGIRPFRGAYSEPNPLRFTRRGTARPGAQPLSDGD